MTKIINKLYNSKERRDSNGRIYYFDNLKFILIFLVVFGHFLEITVNESQISKTIFAFIYTFHMPLFVFVSGYFAKKAIEKKDKDKIAIFMILYLVLKLIVYAIDRILYNRNPDFSIAKVNAIQWYIFAMGIWYTISMLTININKKYIFIASILLSIIIGFDNNIGDILALSRIIVFYPFFLLGTIVNQNIVEGLISNKKLKLISFIFLIVVSFIYIIFIDKIYLIRPILTGRNSYWALKPYIENFGPLIRALWYLGSSLISIAVMCIVPRGKTFFSILGSRTLAVYFLHAIIIKIFARSNIQLRVYEYLIISVLVTFLLSLKCFSNPFNFLMNFKFSNKDKVSKITLKCISKIVIILMTIITLILSCFIVERMNELKYKSLVEQHRYVAHGLGGIGEFSYTNSKEALENSYNNGFKIFETDVKLTSDNQLVCIHGWSKKDYEESLGLEYNSENPIMDYETFKNIEIQGQYTPLTFKELVEFMNEHKDMYVMIDLGRQDYEETKKVYSKILDDCSYNDEILQRLIVGGYSTDMIKAVKEVYKFDLINLYWASKDKREEKISTKAKFVDYCKGEGITSLSVSTNNYSDEFGEYMKNNNMIVYVFTENNQDNANKILKNADLVGTDFIQINSK